MYFMDSNVAIYAVGSEHPYRDVCGEILRRAERSEIEVVISAEILQEILYHYAGRGQAEKGMAVAERLMDIVAAVWPVDRKDIERAMDLMRGNTAIKTRDAIHTAVMLNHDLTDILSADTDFDLIGDIQRTDPLKLA